MNYIKDIMNVSDVKEIKHNFFSLFKEHDRVEQEKKRCLEEFEKFFWNL